MLTEFISTLKNIQKILKCLLSVEIINNSLILTFENDLCIRTKGHQIWYSDREIAIKGKKLHLNPETKINNNDTNNYIIKINKDNQKKLEM